MTTLRRFRWKIAPAVPFLLLSLALSPSVNAQTPAADKSLRVEDADGMASVLKRLEGRAVKIRLVGGGDEVSGKLTKVGRDVAHVSELTGHDFFDAVVRIDQVAAVMVQVRGNR